MSDSTAKQNVVIYGAEWCGFCHQAKKYFDSKDVPYTYHDVEKEPEAAKELAEKMDGPVQGVPVLDVNGTIITGYDLPKINQALGSKTT